MEEHNKISGQEATKDGWIDALYIIDHPDEYSAKAHATSRQHVNRYKFAEKLVAGKRVIDAACGTGYACQMYKKHGYSQYVGLDISPKNVELASERYKSYENTSFFEDDVTNPKNFVPQGHYDIFLSMETIEHVEDVHAFLKFVNKVLKSGGDFVVSTPNRKITNPGKSIYDTPKWEYHVREWILSEFEGLLKSHGFKIEQTYVQSLCLVQPFRRYFLSLHRKLNRKTLGVYPKHWIHSILQPNFFIVHCKKV